MSWTRWPESIRRAAPCAAASAPKQSVNSTPAPASLLSPVRVASNQKIASDYVIAPIRINQMKTVAVESPRALAGNAIA